MIRTRIVLVVPALLGCFGDDISFVAFDDGASRVFTVRVTADHDEELTASVLVRQEVPAEGVSVSVGGVELEPMPIGNGRTDYETDPPADSLDPVVLLRVVSTAHGIDLGVAVPLAVREGSARCLANGGLAVPVRFDRAILPPEHASWRLALVDFESHVVNEIRASGVIPDTVRVDPVMVSPALGQIHVRVESSGELSGSPRPVHLILRSTVEMAAPCQGDPNE